MQTVSAGFTTASQADTQAPLSYLEVAWDTTSSNGLFSAARGGTGWVNETAYLVSHAGSLRISPPGEALVSGGSVATLSVTIDNTTQRFSWQRSDMALYSYIGGAGGMTGKRIRLWQGYTVSGSPEYVCIFSGFIVNWREQTHTGQVILECRDRGWKWLQDKRSTPVYQDKRADEWIVQLCTEIGLGAANRNLDVGIYPIPYCWIDDESIIEEIFDVAAADGGLAFFDQLGILRFQNALHWATQSSVWTFDEGEYRLTDPKNNADALATQVVVEWSGRYEGEDDELYTLDSYKWISPDTPTAGEALTWTARFRYGAIAVHDCDPDDPFNDYAAVSAGGVNMTPYVSIVLSDKYGQQCTVTANNSHPTQAALLQHLVIRGRPLLGGPAEQEEIAVDPSPLTDHERTRSVRGNPYVQTSTQAIGLGSALAYRLKRIRPTWTLSGVAGVPQLELTDPVTFKDDRALGSGNSVTGIVIGIDWQAGIATGYVQTLTVYDVTDLLAYDNYFIIGDTALGGPMTEGAPDDGYGVAWY